MLCDEQPQFGGSLLTDADQASAAWLAASLESLRHNARVTLLARSTAFGYFPHNLIALNQRLTDHLANPPPGEQPRERCWQVRARESSARHRRHRAAAGVSRQ